MQQGNSAHLADDMSYVTGIEHSQHLALVKNLVAILLSAWELQKLMATIQDSIDNLGCYDHKR